MKYLAASIGLDFDWVFKVILFSPIKKTIIIMRSRIVLDDAKI